MQTAAPNWSGCFVFTTMDSETVDYLVTHYFYLLPHQKRLALKHVLHSEKVGGIDDVASCERMRTMLLRCGWLSEDKEVLALLQDGVAAFRQRLAHTIFAENGGEGLLNNCPACSRLARTPTAKQCRHCGADWHRSETVRTL